MDASHDIIEWFRAMCEGISAAELMDATKNVTQGQIDRLVELARDHPLTLDTVKMLFDHAMATSKTTKLLALVQVIGAMNVFFPAAIFSAITLPILHAVGWGHFIAAGSLAAKTQSVWDVNYVFSLLQSAGAGGYGALILQGAGQVYGVVSSAWSGFCSWAGGNSTSAAGD